jgi:arabinogalactan oligomer / maltooligosaccharide transport system permease protein
MNNTISPKKLRMAPIASACFMGLGQVLFLKQYFRGFLLMLFEIVMILAKDSIVGGLVGLVTLGDPHPELPVKMRDHSIFMMIDGLIVLIILAIFIFTYVSNIISAKKEAERIIKNGKFMTLKESRNDIAENSFAVMGITPSVILIAFFCVIPLLFSALVAFTNYSSPDHIPPNNLVDWVGLENFKTMFVASYGGEWAKSFGRVAVWTVIWAVFSTFTCFFAGFFFAVVLQDKRIVLPKVYRTIFILPYAIPTMLSLFVWANLLNGTFGPINRTLIYWGVITKGIPWLSDPNMARITLILVNIWIGFPYSMILTTSSMTAISNSLYEAATIDGANKWQQFKSITFPLVMYQLKPILIMQFAGNINNFGAVFFLTAGGPNLQDTIATQAGSTDLLISWIYKLTMNTPNMYNLASVLSILVFIVLVPFALYNFMRTKSFKESEI